MISGFEIRNEIGGAEACRLFRALRERDGAAVLLKTCDPGNDSGRTALGREFEILRTLSGARVLHVVDLLDQHHRPVLVLQDPGGYPLLAALLTDRKSTRLNSSHSQISYAVFCLKKKKKQKKPDLVINKNKNDKRR